MEDAQYDAVFADLLDEFVPTSMYDHYGSPQGSEGLLSADTASAASLDEDDWQRSAHTTQPQSPEYYCAKPGQLLQHEQYVFM